VLLPTVENMSPLVNSILQTYGFKCQMITNADERFTAMSLSTCALAASGTVSLELMAASTPAVIAYKIGTFTGFMVRYLISVKYVTILNIMLDRKIIPEHLQENCTMENIMISLEKLLECEDTRNIQLKAYQKGLKMLGAYDESPALRAAKEVTSLLFNGG
jgi:lipid-A-disaccharide synthase